MSLANTEDYTVEETMESGRKGEGKRERIRRRRRKRMSWMDGKSSKGEVKREGKGRGSKDRLLKKGNSTRYKVLVELHVFGGIRKRKT